MPGAKKEVMELRGAAGRGVPVAQCSATRRAGGRCTNPAILGGSVCPYHGGGAPQVREAARRRLLELVPDAIEAMAELGGLVGDGARDERVRQHALADVLDRAGLRPADQIQVSEAPAPNEELDRAIVEAMQKRGLAPALGDGIPDAEVVE